jgi:hypothetical protein
MPSPAAEKADNNAMATRTVNVKNNEPMLESLILSAEKTHFIRKKDTFYQDYLPVRAPIKVMATYSDGHSEEVTDRVEWLDLQGKIAMGTDYFRAERGTYTLRASLQGIESNEITIDVEDDTSLVMHEVSYKENFSNISIAVTLLNKPTQEVSLTLHLNAEEKVAFIDNYPLHPKQSYTLTFKPERWRENFPDIQYVTVKVLDTTMTSPIVVTTEPMVSADPNYGNKNPRDIEISRRPELILDAPSLDERKGAIRGVPIKFRVTTGEQHWTKVTLIDPPKGMRVLKPTFIENTELYGIDVQWDVPMDAKEGEIYKITAKATDPIGREKTITFPIKVPKTTPIQTKIENNELIVTDKNSLLYGMKMKGHNGEDISTLQLRSVNYRDVWKYNGKPLDTTKPIGHTVFVVDNMPEKLDIKFPPYMDTFDKRIQRGTGFYRYFERISRGYYWSWRHRSDGLYLYEGTNGVSIPKKYHKKETEGSKVFIFTINEDIR